MKLAIQSLRYIGTFPRRRGEVWMMVGQDGGQSIPTDGGTLFVFSDTLLAALSPQHPRSPVPRAFGQLGGERGVFLANTAGIAPRGRDLLAAWGGIRYYTDANGFPREILPPLQREQAQRIRFWPEHGVWLEGRVVLFYLGIQTVDPTTIWGFRTLGTGLATLDPASGGCERVWFGDDWRLWKPLRDDAHFGVQVLREDDYLYVFGSVRAGLFHRARLARVRPAEVAQPEAYEYLLSPQQPRWGGSLTEACDLGPCSGDYSVSFNEHVRRYLMFYVDSYEKQLMVRAAERLWGPYTMPATIVRLPHEPATELIYLGFEHPDFSLDAGRTVFVSYCQPRFTSNSLLNLRFR
jgi:hypothetical protein